MRLLFAVFFSFASLNAHSLSFEWIGFSSGELTNERVTIRTGLPVLSTFTTNSSIVYVSSDYGRRTIDGYSDPIYAYSELMVASKIEIYPNPSSGLVSLELSELD